MRRAPLVVAPDASESREYLLVKAAAWEADAARHRDNARRFPRMAKHFLDVAATLDAAAADYRARHTAETALAARAGRWAA